MAVDYPESNCVLLVLITFLLDLINRFQVQIDNMKTSQREPM